MIERLIVTLILALVALGAVSWLLIHLGLLLVAGLGLVGWAWWRRRQHA